MALRKKTEAWAISKSAISSEMKKLFRKGSLRTAKRQPRFTREIAILHEDDFVLALNKPAGLLAVPVKGPETPSALSVLSEELKSNRQRAYIVHRIDRFTSGVLLFAKTQAAREALVRQFRAHTPVREYLAIVRGHIASAQGTLVHYFRRDRQFQKLSTERDPLAARAELGYSVERQLRGASLVRVTLVTGLQNQIRAQFAAIGHHVVGDRKYCPEEALERRIDRVALHAARLQFAHPFSGENVSVQCKPPFEFQSLLRALSLSHRGK